MYSLDLKKNYIILILIRNVTHYRVISEKQPGFKLVYFKTFFSENGLKKKQYFQYLTFKYATLKM